MHPSCTVVALEGGPPEVKTHNDGSLHLEVHLKASVTWRSFPSLVWGKCHSSGSLNPSLSRPSSNRPQAKRALNTAYAEPEDTEQAPLRTVQPADKR